MEPRYDIDFKLLRSQFKLYQKFIHPDKFEMSEEGTTIKDIAHEVSSFANNAFQILSNDIERAEYLIKLSNSENSAANVNFKDGMVEESIILNDTDLVERIFELRMTISESEDLEELREIKTALERDYSDEIASLAATFITTGNNTSGFNIHCSGDKNCKCGKGEERRNIINRARYLQKMREEVTERIELMGGCSI
jgi:hypothetical protein